MPNLVVAGKTNLAGHHTSQDTSSDKLTRHFMLTATGTTQGVGGFFKTSLRRDLGLNAFASVCQRYKKSH